MRHAAGNLPCSQNRIKNLAYFLQRDKVIHGNTVRREIHGDLGNIHGPGISGVSFAAIFFIVPEDIARRLKPTVRFQRSVCRDVFTARRAKLFRSVAVSKKPTLRQRLLDSLRRGLNEFSDDHRRARSDSRTAVRYDSCIRLRDDDTLIGESQRLGCNLAEHGVGSLAEFGTGHQYTHLAVGRGFHADQRIQIAFAGASESSAVQENGDADTFFA